MSVGPDPVGHGTVFALPLPDGERLHGRVLLNIHRQCVRPGLIRPDSPLTFFDGTVLVEIWKGPPDRSEGSDVVVAGFFLDTEPLRQGEWPTVGTVDVDPEGVEFPQTFARFNGELVFVRGEIRVPMPGEQPDPDVLPTITSPYALPKLCAHRLGLHHLLTPSQRRTMDLGRLDLRFSARGAEHRRALGSAALAPYGQAARLHGHDTGRFYPL